MDPRRQLCASFQLVETGVSAALVTRNGTTRGGIVLSAGRFAHAGSRTYYAERLSRVYAPGVDSKQPGEWNGAAASCHVALAGATQTPTPTRDRGWYKAFD